MFQDLMRLVKDREMLQAQLNRRSYEMLGLQREIDTQEGNIRDTMHAEAFGCSLVYIHERLNELDGLRNRLNMLYARQANLTDRLITNELQIKSVCRIVATWDRARPTTGFDGSATEEQIATLTAVINAHDDMANSDLLP